VAGPKIVRNAGGAGGRTEHITTSATITAGKMAAGPATVSAGK
jgi:hypothetical protein